MSKLESLLDDFEKALERFTEILQEPKTDIVRDSAIKRFELIFDLVWKTVKVFLEEYHRAVCHSPRACFKEAFKQKLINYDKFWLDIIDLRNDTAHTYKESLADEVYAKLPKAVGYFGRLLENIKKEAGEIRNI